MKKGFTLAEVLITLGIIGVVAALTLPTIVNKYKEKVTVTRVKKFYSVMNQALLSAINKNGYVDEWDAADDTEKLTKIILPELKIAKDCKGNPECLYSGMYKLLNGENWTTTYASSSRYYKMILADGSLSWMRHNDSSICANDDMDTQNVCAVLWYDVNGKQAPNTIGKDVFVFYIMKNRIIPHQTDDCEINSTGWGCANYILQNGTMNYLYQ